MLHIFTVLHKIISIKFVCSQTRFNTMLERNFRCATSKNKTFFFDIATMALNKVITKLILLSNKSQTVAV